MKTYKHLWPQLCNFLNIYRAWRAAHRGKSTKAQAIRFEHNLEENLHDLVQELQDGSYQPGP